jgi:hypothetical protein
MPTAAETIVIPAPDGIPEAFFIHKISGKVVAVHIVAFRVDADGVEAVEWPTLEGPHWVRADRLGDGQWSAHGRIGRNPQDLGNAIKTGRPQ